MCVCVCVCVQCISVHCVHVYVMEAKAHLGSPLGDSNPSKLNTAHYMHAPQNVFRRAFTPPPPLGIFLHEPLGERMMQEEVRAGGGGGKEATHKV